MSIPAPFSFRARFRSFRFAARGIRLILLGEHNAWVHAAFTLAVVAGGLLLRVTQIQWCALVLAMMAVWTAEAINTAFEFLCDVASPSFHPQVERAKDVASGAVLISAMGAVVVGVPRLCLKTQWPHDGPERAWLRGGATKQCLNTHGEE